ncbi:hypothetical protein CRM93_03275 [Acetobacter fabarum]|uniref:Uncharacterized protein n=1 Tax=Acetobacter fabarum TaxID=483199 RepID=A0A269Y0E0_9PROT|nr:hypothetical protein B8X00_03855 [Acetobacter fabarum]PEN28074.1 hypothetical protein CRM93_03275 [Acetobacter fabarum]
MLQKTEWEKRCTIMERSLRLHCVQTRLVQAKEPPLTPEQLAVNPLPPPLTVTVMGCFQLVPYTK